MALCDRCGTTTHYRNQRGTRLADLRCLKPAPGAPGTLAAGPNVCGGRLGAAMWRASECRYVPMPKSAGLKGRKMRTCVACGRRRFNGLILLDEPREILSCGPAVADGYAWRGPFGVGAPVCRTHDQRPPQEFCPAPCGASVGAPPSAHAPGCPRLQGARP